MNVDNFIARETYRIVAEHCQEMTGLMGKTCSHMMMDKRMVLGRATLDAILLEVHEDERKRRALALLGGTKNGGGFYLGQKVLFQFLCCSSQQ